MRNFLISLLAGLSIIGPAIPSMAAPITIADFAAQPTIRDPQLSPDGRKIAARVTVEGVAKLVIINADDPEAAPKNILLGKAVLSELHWAGNGRLLLTIISKSEVFGLVVPTSRLIVLDLADGRSRIADPKSRGIYGGDVLYADPTGQWALVASQNDIYSTPSVKRVDLATGKAEVVEKGRPNVWDWYVDTRGVVRAGLAYDEHRWTMWYREEPGHPLKPIKGKTGKDSSVDRVSFGQAGAGTIITNERTGRFGVYRYDFKTGQIGDAVFEHPSVDVADVRADRLTGEISAVRYEDDRHRFVWLDPKLKKLQARLDTALPEAVNAIVDWSDGGDRVLVWSGGAADPGSYFLLDQNTSRMRPVITPFERIDAAKLSPVKPVTYRSRDGLVIPAYLTLPKGGTGERLPLILMPHGGPFLRDSWVYDPWVQFLAGQGYAVLQPQFRGSTGYGKDFVEKGYGEWGRKMQDDLDDGVDWMIGTGQADPRRVCIVGASYGGYAALWGAIRTPERYRCAVSYAGVTDLSAQLRDNRKSFSATRYFRQWRVKVAGESGHDLQALSPLAQAARLKVPVLIAHGEQDTVVSVKQGQAMEKALRAAGADVTSVFYKDTGHSFSDSDDLADFLQRLDSFLAKHNPATPAS
ncbi:S9 family peptidase [Sphingomonas sp. LY54]|uniref:alpha/beta hydrolase family protein n=1 Tax=Sphingomonas sp. LY54 TaxID=3095343 RepID=UPI002D79957F|nr:S9 family peptidase [Sphingomonas sp. LY54]WRP29492.1 S9 family peptidase [Sphingomonas sp. LY54]